MKFLNFILIFFLVLRDLKANLNHNDAECDNQLTRFDNALENREQWALMCE